MSRRSDRRKHLKFLVVHFASDEDEAARRGVPTLDKARGIAWHFMSLFPGLNKSGKPRGVTIYNIEENVVVEAFRHTKAGWRRVK